MTTVSADVLSLITSPNILGGRQPDDRTECGEGMYSMWRHRWWREAAGDYGAEGSYRSVADIVSPESLTKVREFKRAAKAAAKG